MSALTVAPSAGGDLVLDHAGATFDAGNEMFGRGLDESDFELSPTPYAS